MGRKAKPSGRRNANAEKSTIVVCAVCMLGKQSRAAPLLASACLLVVGSHLMSPAKSFVDRVASFVTDLASLPLASSFHRSERKQHRAGCPAHSPLAWLATSLGDHVMFLEGSLPVGEMQEQERKQRSSYPKLPLAFPACVSVSRRNERAKISPRLIFM